LRPGGIGLAETGPCCYGVFMEEKPRMKILGKRKPYSGGLEAMQGFFEMMIRLRGNQPFMPRGVYRFKSHEEAAKWTLKMLNRPKAGRPL